MAQPEEEPTFQVRDRRRRSGGESAEPESNETEAPTQAPPSSRQPTPEARAPVGERPAAEERPAVGPAPASSAERSLVGLFVMLAGLAAAALEGMPDPATGQLHRDPQQAVEMIDVLMLLREKTEGRRTPEETQVLEEIIYELQVSYVRATTRSG